MVCGCGEHTGSGQRPRGAVGFGLCAQRGRKGSWGRPTGPSRFSRKTLAIVPSTRCERSPQRVGDSSSLPSLPRGRRRPEEGFAAALVSWEGCFPSDKGCSRRLFLHLLDFQRLQLRCSLAQPGGPSRFPAAGGYTPTALSGTSSRRAVSPALPRPCLPRSRPSAGVPAPLPSARWSRLQHAFWGQSLRRAHTPALSPPWLPVCHLTPGAEPSSSGGPGA